MNQPPGSRNRDGSLPFYRKVLLAAAMTGNEICVSFQQLYQVPLLQIQGVPVTYVSLYPIVAGPVALLLLNLSGCLSDRGSNHQKRKAIVVALIAAITMLGIVVVVVANSKLLSADQCTGSTNETTCFDESDSPGRRDADNQSHFTFTNESFLTSDDFPAMVTAVTDHSAARRDSSLDDEDALSVPVTALLGLSGFALMDIGYDVNQASIRTSVLASSSQSDHSVLLLLSLALAAFGGCITNTLGLLDLSQLFGWGAEDGSVVAQTTVQLLVCGLVLLVTVTSTVTTALLGTPTLRPPAFTPLHEDGTESEQIACYGMKVDFCLSHGLMAAAVLCLALTKQLAAFYVCCVLYSFQRSAFFSVPYIIANDYAQKQEHCGHGQSETGRLMAILGSMVPLNYCTVFMVSGPLITLTNYDGAPLIVSSACAGLATLLFMVIYRP
ncbi:uncharacterized protein LOC143281004 isoform X2 [Babylonia areolata]|uniref:uncharacterized protein LOC143281004 isoform X2 n=1 Tax=Babylonia areolata TaxID=304850 RepID=UPI003FCF0521